MQKWMDRFLELADVQDGSLLDAAILTETGMTWWRHASGHSCSNGQSSTKLFTAVSIAILIDEGRLRWDDVIADMFPELWPQGMDEGWRKVTVHDAITHTMGIDQGIDIEGEELPGGGLVDYLTLAFALPLPYQPGEHYQYTDIAFYMLSRVVEKVSGWTLENFIRKRMGRVMGFRDFAIASCPMGHNFGGGCMYMRASDMVKLGYMLACGGVYEGTRLLREETVQLMMERGYALYHPPGSNFYIKTGAYGQCIVFSTVHKLAFAWHRTAYDVKPVPDRNDTLLAVASQVEKEMFDKE